MIQELVGLLGTRYLVVRGLCIALEGFEQLSKVHCSQLANYGKRRFFIILAVKMF